MNKPIRRVAIAVLVLFTLLVLNLNYVQVVDSERLRTDPGNTRLLNEEYSRQRGSIVVAGTPIAISEATDDRLKYLRTYPQAEMYAALTGSYSLVFGASALERAENDVLAGSDDRFFVGRLGDIFAGRDPKGGNVVLTIDPAAQEAAYNALADTGATGAVVALDPKTGAVLAMASTPTYDPNQLSSHDPDAIRTYSEQLDQEPVDPRLNQATQASYPPGSVFKIVIAAAALEAGYQTDTKIPAPDLLELPNTSTTLSNFGNSSCNGGADDTLMHALTISCNTAFAQLGIDLGESKVRSMAEKFGIDGKTMDIPVGVASSSIGDIADDAALGQTSIGQRDVQLTPLQAAMLSATVANDGTLMKPYLVKELQEPDLSVLDKTDPEEVDQAFSSGTADKLTEMMVSVVDNGSGTAAQISGIDVAGKTGTAEVDPGVPAHTWFSGFAPADDPQIAVAVFIKNGGDSESEATGGEVSAPIAKTVMEAYLSAHGGDD